MIKNAQKKLLKFTPSLFEMIIKLLLTVIKYIRKGKMGLIRLRQVQIKAERSGKAFIKAQRAVWLASPIFKDVRIEKFRKFGCSVQVLGILGESVE